MKKLISVFFILTFLFLSGCSLKVDGPKVKLPGVVIGGGGGSHCPPGQAKKGNC